MAWRPREKSNSRAPNPPEAGWLNCRISRAPRGNTRVKIKDFDAKKCSPCTLFGRYSEIVEDLHVRIFEDFGRFPEKCANRALLDDEPVRFVAGFVLRAKPYLRVFRSRQRRGPISTPSVRKSALLVQITRPPVVGLRPGVPVEPGQILKNSKVFK